MQVARGYFDKRRGDAIVTVRADVDYLVTVMARNGEATAVSASVSTPPSEFISPSASAASDNGIELVVPPTSVVTLGPFAMHGGEVFTLNSNQRNLTVFVTVQTDDPNPQVGMWG